VVVVVGSVYCILVLSDVFLCMIGRVGVVKGSGDESGFVRME